MAALADLEEERRQGKKGKRESKETGSAMLVRCFYRAGGTVRMGLNIGLTSSRIGGGAGQMRWLLLRRMHIRVGGRRYGGGGGR